MTTSLTLPYRASDLFDSNQLITNFGSETLRGQEAGVWGASSRASCSCRHKDKTIYTYSDSMPTLQALANHGCI
ncbi:hypothetical protein J6590_094755 [Homalodisca vitripennis]|nr:hypothetical protein J6590_094081 [Homalodisca vitripennis]KAG8275040.1 hypothetical protein J6590_094755 [Homalodisca vitripennis]